jgi:hypothetical protein
VTRGPNFIDREEFNSLLAKVKRKDGEQYEDVPTAYGDMSRLVVAWLARTKPEELKDLYNEFGWQSSANARQFHLAARSWFEKYHPDKHLPWKEVDTT